MRKHHAPSLSGYARPQDTSILFTLVPPSPLPPFTAALRAHSDFCSHPAYGSQNAKSDDQPRTKSARAATRGSNEATPAPRADLGPPPEAPTLEARLRASAPHDPSPQVRCGKALEWETLGVRVVKNRQRLMPMVSEAARAKPVDWFRALRWRNNRVLLPVIDTAMPPASFLAAYDAPLPLGRFSSRASPAPVLRSIMHRVHRAFFFVSAVHVTVRNRCHATAVHHRHFLGGDIDLHWFSCHLVVSCLVVVTLKRLTRGWSLFL